MLRLESKADMLFTKWLYTVKPNKSKKDTYQQSVKLFNQHWNNSQQANWHGENRFFNDGGCSGSSLTILDVWWKQFYD